MTKVTLPSQNIRMDTPTGIEPVWYDKLNALAAQVAAQDVTLSTLAAFVQNGAYRELSYTPVLSSSGGTLPTFTATPLTGRAFRIGRLCFVRVAATNIAGGTPGAGAFQLSLSLPVPVAATAVAGRVTSGMWYNSTTESAAYADGAAGSSTVKMYSLASGGNQVALNCADFNNVTRGVSFALYYPTD